MDYRTILTDERLDPHRTILENYQDLLALLTREDIIQIMLQVCMPSGGCPLAAALTNLDVFNAFKEQFSNCNDGDPYIGDVYPDIHHFPAAIGAFVGIIMLKHGFQKMSDNTRYPIGWFIKSAACFQR